MIPFLENKKIRDPLAKQLCPAQRGFVQGRQLIQNVVDLDSEARVISMTHRTGSLPLMAFFDFAAAFPSVIHGWIELVVRSYGLPDGLANLIGVYYACNLACTQVQNEIMFLLMIVSGVHQGCPMSGWIFALIFDPFVELFYRNIEVAGKGIARVCADDVGAAVNDIGCLVTLHHVFKLAQLFAGLTLKKSEVYSRSYRRPFQDAGY